MTPATIAAFLGALEAILAEVPALITGVETIVARLKGTSGPTTLGPEDAATAMKDDAGKLAAFK